MAWRAAAALATVVILAACASRETIGLDPVPKTFPREQVAKGAELAHLGNCLSCHTAEGGKPYAGGTPLKTPFGTIYGTNITPDAETGIGAWPLAAFSRAMREGVDREGRHLYPVFPYDHFTKLTDDDVAALYAFIMTREPVRQENRRNSVPIPRPLVGFWKSRYLEQVRYQPDPARSAEWNRGAYLVEGLAHCGACHTPRNSLGAERKDQAFAGGEVEGWHAPALNSASPSPLPWTVEALRAYLRHGIADRHAISAGPMVDVTHGLSEVSDEALRAIAVYTVSLDKRSDDERRRAGEAALARARASVAVKGNAVYDGACADCHNRGRAQEGGALELPLGTALTIPTPRNLAYIIRDGIVPREGDRGGWMPGYAGALTDEQMTDLLTYLRALGGQPAWRDVASEVRRIAKEQR
ncbi:MAG TPA: cytochrome c [Burkholderiales bacterium]|nr:cytochrome c [Burkholderiales bacterium]